MPTDRNNAAPLHLSRRRFVQGVAGGALLLGAAPRVSWDAASAARSVLTGLDFDLTIGETPVNYTGVARTATAVNGQVPAPLLRMRQGDTVTLRVRNRLAVTSSIHWHGVIVPADMDGVPGLSFPGIAAGETFTYRFTVNQYGTYWYHAHSRFQEQTGLYGPLVIDRRGGERQHSDREHVVLLSDWSDSDPEHIYATLKRQSDYFNFGKRTVGDMPDMNNMPGMDHGSMSQAPGESMQGMNHGAMPGMKDGAGATKDSDEMAEMNHSDMDHAMSVAPPSSAPGTALHHAPTEFGPTVDARVTQASARLDDPGVGLRDNGRRVLTYADLHTLGGPIDRREASREIELHLTGHMERFIWSFNGQKFSEAAPLRFEYGERLRIVLVNDSMMTHPIHLHGMWSEVEAEDGAFLVRKHTVTVQPAQRLSYLVTADALGRWAYHCHLLYHMDAGMFREVVVAQGDDAAPGRRS